MGADVAWLTGPCACLVASVAMAILGGCGLTPVEPVRTDLARVEDECRGDDPGLLYRVPRRTDGSPSRSCGETLRFYQPFAAMAAAVYDPRDRIDEQLTVVAGSSWLQQKITRLDDETSRTLLKRLLSPEERSKLFRNRIGRHCDGEKGEWTANAHDGAVLAAQSSCRTAAPQLPKTVPWYEFFTKSANDESELRDAHGDSSNGFDEVKPLDWQQCDYVDGKHNPAVPVKEMTAGWETVPELQRRLQPRGWSMFVPGLVIDLWRRDRDAQGDSPLIEYALVFRGTADGGGWLSNFRALTAFTPLVWDQYRQAELATIDLVNQIYQLHTLSDELFDRDADTRIKITAVGHSLGGGLAQYVFLRVPQITRVVAFDPSPVTGSSSFSPTPVSERARERGRRDRASVLSAGRQPLDRDATYDDQASIFVLYEQGDALTALAGCTSGSLWGDEGGPHLRCDSVNLSGGSAIRQHNMPQLACKINLAVGGLRTRP